MSDTQALLDKLYMLSQIIQDVSDASDRQTVAPMLTKSQFQLLTILALGGERTVTELAELLNISRPAISKTIDKLVHQLLVTRAEDHSDRRTVHLNATALGNNIIKNYHQKRAKRLEDLETHYSPEELTLFDSMIERYINHCVAIEGTMELVCIQCNSQYQDQCGKKEISGKCRFGIRPV